MNIIDPYVYKGTTVLINKLGIKDEAKLDQAETNSVILATNALRRSDFQISTIFDCLEIHRRLFKSLYEWAGELRTIDIYKAEPLLDGKSIDYVFAFYLQQALTDLQKEFARIEWDELEPKAKIEKVCYFVSEFWHIHPFREGNTRTSAMMLYFLIKKAGLHVDLSFLSRNAKYFRNALALSCLYSASKTEYLFGIVADSATIKNEATGKYETIEGKEVRKYAYTRHTLERLETVKDPFNRYKKAKSNNH